MRGKPQSTPQRVPPRGGIGFGRWDPLRREPCRPRSPLGFIDQIFAQIIIDKTLRKEPPVAGSAFLSMPPTDHSNDRLSQGEEADTSFRISLQQRYEVLFVEFLVACQFSIFCHSASLIGGEVYRLILPAPSRACAIAKSTSSCEWKKPSKKL